MRIFSFSRPTSILIALVAFSAVLSGVSVVVPSLWWCAFLGPVFFLCILFSSRESLSLRSIFSFGTLFGFLFHLIVYLPAWDTHPLSWAGVEGFFLPHAFIGFTWMLYSLIVALPWGLLAMGIRLFSRKISDPLATVLFVSGGQGNFKCSF